VTRSWLRLAALAAAVVTGVAGTSLPAGAARPGGGPAAGHYTGALADGGSWVADVPAAWNGVLVLYSHGFGTLQASDAPDPATGAALLAQGYALAGSSYEPHGSLWALSSALGDQFSALAAAEKLTGRPRLRLALGTSMGGLISAQEAEHAGGRLDGALSTCGLVEGGIDLNNYQLDGEYALSRLLAPGQDVKLVGYASPAEGAAAAGALSAAATAARATAAGRARVALGTALLDLPTWSPAQAAPPSDPEGIADAQYDWLVSTLPFIMPSRYFIELAVGGNASWNAGVDYARLLARSPNRAMVTALYRQAGLSLGADLATLTRHASVRADADAVRELARTSTVAGRPRVPVLDLHTGYDQLAPVEVEHRYAEQVHDARLLRQAYVSRRGHCAFMPSEILASLGALRHRIAAGRWDAVATAPALQRAALGYGLGDGPAFADLRPGPLVSHRWPAIVQR
jgi:hypothetical protein